MQGAFACQDEERDRGIEGYQWMHVLSKIRGYKQTISLRVKGDVRTVCEEVERIGEDGEGMKP